ncbi:MAG: hypothetical protein P4L50_21650 [Anaerolineaceae bacterium]|nr:hypothetical protein [Anaerolineaceae bacterium]
MNIKKETRNQILLWVLIMLVFSSPLLYSHFWLGVGLFLVGSLVIAAGILLSNRNSSS